MIQESRMPFGKYEGKRLSEIATDYLKWLLREANIEDNKELATAVNEELKCRKSVVRRAWRIAAPFARLGVKWWCLSTLVFAIVIFVVAGFSPTNYKNACSTPYSKINYFIPAGYIGCWLASPMEK